MILSSILKMGAVVIIANEIRGLILAGPVFYGIYQAGGTWAAIWLGVCSLFGIAMSVVVPLFMVKWIRPFLEKRFPSAFKGPAQ
jgi:fumarate reductase subunit D